MFPAGAGMNRSWPIRFPRFRGVPRRRGDEPEEDSFYVADEKCSPQARG